MAAGQRHQGEGRIAEAVECFTRALAAKPDSADAFASRAVALKAQGKPANALEDAVRAMSLADSQVAESVFIDCLGSLRFTGESPGIAPYLTRALTDSWCPPERIGWAAAAVIKLDSAISACLQKSTDGLLDETGFATLAGHDLLIALLTTALVCDVEIERFLKIARRSMLHHADRPEVNVAMARFGGALARQCFINEYIFELEDDEAVAAAALKDTLQAAIDSGDPVEPFKLVVLGSYYPLHILRGSELLLGGQWPDAVDKLLAQQIKEPADEAALASGIPRITAIDDRVSRLVREQYEQNPYPRWMSTAPSHAAAGLDGFLHLNFPGVEVQPINDDGVMDVLVAGCGTGLHSIQVGTLFPAAAVLAIDLSVSSLAYAKRKTAEMGVTNIEYAQADILELPALNRRFHLIESKGVLHHMGDPEAAWRCLLASLRPRGVMGIGLYSELARQVIDTDRRYIAERTYSASAADIRRCRAEIIARTTSAQWWLQSPDFFSLSACRDLLFHVQEHRFTIPRIKSFVEANGLRFLGFMVRENVKARYRERFPDDVLMTDLDRWHAFETENPRTFGNMYEFYVQQT